MVVGHREYELEMRRCLSYRKQEWRVDVMDFPCKAEAIELVRSIVEPSRTRSSDGGKRQQPRRFLPLQAEPPSPWRAF